MKQIVTTVILAALSASMATQTAALSCMRPDVAQSFAWASDADKAYVILLGAFDFAAPPPVDMSNNTPETLVVPATFKGSYLSADGFVRGAELNVALAFSCAGPWCGRLGPQTNAILAFVEQSEDGYILNVGPCGGDAFVNPTPEDIARVEDCMRGGPCAPLTQ